ncbi:glycoside hydrolase family 3 C-terminal domain-containing protein [Paenibacillus sp. GCM10027629]|uniref:beta-glucosidase n=1 Tax=Paenibacillus sp. GCM10027629 TaxID=3273414 RepID=UPI00363FFDF3
MSKPVKSKKTTTIWVAILLALIIGTIVTVSIFTVSTMVTVLLVASSILAVAVLVYGFILAKRNKAEKKGLRRLWITLLSLGLVVVVGLNAGVYQYQVVINQYLTKAKVDEAELAKATEASKSIVEQIEDEGLVLLENKQNTLPLNTSNDREKNVNVFGQASIRMVYGGSGSGSGDESANVTIQQGLEKAGFTVNNELTQFYQTHAPAKKEMNVFDMNGGDYTLHEPKNSDFGDKLLADAEKFSDVALIVLSRAGGEGGDLPLETAEYGGSKDRHYLQLSAAEEQLIKMVTSRNFKKVVVVVNSSNAMELGFLKNEDIDAAIQIGGPGSTGNTSVGSVLAGKVNPSGRLVDTYAYDVTSAPAFYNAGDFKYSNSEHTTVDKYGDSYPKFLNFVNYNEGIYVGYRYYETRYVNNETGLMNEAAYQKAVQYPFGYGLSYTNFKQEITNYTTTDDKISVDVKVTNTGTTAGKEVVQLYYTAPYQVGGIEKSHVVLGAFDKTKLLEPGASETVKLEITVEDMASYDSKNKKAYVLDAGTYDIKLMNNAHDVIDSRTYQVKDTVVYNQDHKRSSDQVTATNTFDEAAGDLTYVSRADWEGTLPKERTKDKEASQELIQALKDQQVIDNPDDKDIVFAKHGLTLKDVAGLDYNDPKWNDLLEQLSIKDMTQLIGYGGYATQAVDSIRKPIVTDLDGPAGINALLTGLKGVQYMTEVVLASTWNMDLAQKMGETLANEATVYSVSGLYAPAMNIHRTPFSGRNFEYYSEDALLSGKMGAAVVQGAATKGVYTFIKHFALNDQETNRDGVAVWSNEQAIRELYLKPFEISIKEGKSSAVMSSYSRIGTKWAGAHAGLFKTVLRDEWGFKGMVISDFDMYPFMNVDQAIRAGNDLMLTTLGDKPTKLSTDTNTGRQAMRTASHNILYTVANSNAQDIVTPYPYWVLLLGLADILLLALLVLGFKKVTRQRNRKTEVLSDPNQNL